MIFIKYIIINEHSNREIIEQLYNISVNGTPEQAKHSTYLLTYMNNKDEILKKLIKVIINRKEK